MASTRPTWSAYRRRTRPMTFVVVFAVVVAALFLVSVSPVLMSVQPAPASVVDPPAWVVVEQPAWVVADAGFRWRHGLPAAPRSRAPLDDSIARVPIGCPVDGPWSTGASAFNGAAFFASRHPIQVVGLFDYRAFEEQIDLGSGRPVPGALLHLHYLPEFDSDENPGTVAIFRHAYVVGPYTHVYNCRIKWLAGGCKVFPHPGNAVDDWDSGRLASATVLDGRVVSIWQYWGPAFYHFFMEAFPRIALVHQFVVDNPDVRIITPAIGATYELFDLIGIDRSRLIVKGEGDNFFVETLLVPTPTACGRASRPALKALKALIRAGFVKKHGEPTRDPGRRVIVVQRREGARALLNHDDLVERLRKEFPRAQIGVFQHNDNLEAAIRKHFHADLIIGPHGAGISNVMFAPAKDFGFIEIHPVPGNGVDHMGPLFINTCHMHSVIRSGGLYRAVVERNSAGVGGPITVDIDVVVKHARELVDLLPPPP
ncbi:unnamed protein product (mitochondrion) [Plasmodiophora brassicae]|uniref:Glycosyltransferase 61 catalytic domain-containing protein n=1 Tax=Plasmodiophora brassicae TaxID=37360 RepID=A0A3P3YIH7_PLABS|nr:unnamed protein product [Plasmodiophora brassicae]